MIFLWTAVSLPLGRAHPRIIWVAVQRLRPHTGTLICHCVLPANQHKKRADERTRTADLISLRVCGQWLLSVAGVCNSRMDKGFSVPCLAHYCRALRPG